jgi:hypothetical protein
VRWEAVRPSRNSGRSKCNELFKSLVTPKNILFKKYTLVSRARGLLSSVSFILDNRVEGLLVYNTVFGNLYENIL